MKKHLALTIIALLSSISTVGAQTENRNIVQPDSLTMSYISDIAFELSQLKPRYKMYPTKNIHILLKLDTATGAVWMVQYRLGNTEAMTIPVNDTSLLWSFETIQNGRYELYPTENMYNFILLDTKRGGTWQVQWSFDEDKRFKDLIY